MTNQFLQSDTSTAGKPWYKKWWGVMTIIIAFLLLVLATALGFLIYNKVNELKDQPFKLGGEQFKNTEGISSPWFGTSTPKLTIVEFADFACPYSKKSFSKIRSLGLKYDNLIKVIYRDFPFTAEESLRLAMAARCAGDQGLYWQMHDKLFQNQGVKTDQELKILAGQLNLDISRFNSCLTQEKYLSHVKQDILDAERLGVQGTPTWFIDGYKLQGDIPENLLERIIEDSINKQ